jgi:hypothetical protein
MNCVKFRTAAGHRPENKFSCTLFEKSGSHRFKINFATAWLKKATLYGIFSTFNIG